MTIPMDIICNLVGEITEAPFEYVDYAVIPQMGLFVPVTGQCYYALTPEHTHPSYSLVVSFDDFCQVKIDDKIIRSTAGTFTGFSPQVPHQELPADVPARYVAIMIDKAYFESALQNYNTSPLTLRGDTFPSTPRLLAALREFMAEYEDKAPGYEVLLNATALKITHLLIRQILNVKKSDEKVDFRMAANHAIEFMHQALSEKLTITDLARVARLSPSHFARVFKTETGVSPIEYLLELRLMRSKRLLRDGDHSITNIALACGFNSSSYLSRCFQAKFGISPSKFRKSLRQSA